MSEETKDYARGYAAGSRRRDESHQREHERHMARMALAAAIAPEIIRSPWVSKKDGVTKTLNTAEGMARTVAGLVNAITRKI